MNGSLKQPEFLEQAAALTKCNAAHRHGTTHRERIPQTIQTSTYAERHSVSGKSPDLLIINVVPERDITLARPVIKSRFFVDFPRRSMIVGPHAGCMTFTSFETQRLMHHNR